MTGDAAGAARGLAIPRLQGTWGLDLPRTCAARWASVRRSKLGAMCSIQSSDPPPTIVEMVPCATEVERVTISGRVLVSWSADLGRTSHDVAYLLQPDSAGNGDERVQLVACPARSKGGGLLPRGEPLPGRVEFDMTDPDRLMLLISCALDETFT